MKKSLGFWASVEQYVWRVTSRNPLPWSYMGIGLVVLVVLASALNVKSSVVGARDVREVILQAAEIGDYETAREIYESCTVSPCHSVTGNVLGVESELEDLVYPERVVERRIKEIESKLQEYPGNKELYLELARLHGEIELDERAQEYWEMARVLDPNGAEFR